MKRCQGQQRQVVKPANQSSGRAAVRVASIATLLLGAGVALPRVASASACCASAAAIGPGRLLAWEDFAVGLSTAAATTFGEDVYGSYSGYDSRYAESELRGKLWGIARVTERFTVDARIEALRNARSSSMGDSGFSESGGGFGETTAGALLQLLAPGDLGDRQWLPAVWIGAQLLMPTGRPTERSAKLLASDVTGRGYWVPSVSLGIEKAYSPFYVRLEMALSVPLPRAVTYGEGFTATQRLGISELFLLATGVELFTDFVVSALARFEHQWPLITDGVREADSQQREMGAGLSVAWRFNSHFTVQLMGQRDIPWRVATRNRKSDLSGSVALRYGYY